MAEHLYISCRQACGSWPCSNSAGLALTSRNITASAVAQHAADTGHAINSDEATVVFGVFNFRRFEVVLRVYRQNFFNN